MTTTLSGNRILVVEDDYLVASDLVAQLSAIGVEVVGPAANIDAAFKEIGSGSEMNGAVLDINLDGEMVFPLADELERRAVPFIFATGYDPHVLPARHADKILLRKPLENAAVIEALLKAAMVDPITAKQASANEVLRRLSGPDLDAILPLLRKVFLPRGAIIEMPGQKINRIYFPLDCVGSLIVVGRNGSRIETGLVGNEGMTGFGIVQGDEESPYELINQIAGHTLAMALEDFKKALDTVPALGLLGARFARSLSIQVSYTALANGRFDILPRLARWLVMIQDRVPQNPFSLTHDYLSIMLGVRRSSVTDALHRLESKRLIRSTRSFVNILDREGLIREAGEIYGSSEQEYARLMSLPLTADMPYPVQT